METDSDMPSPGRPRSRGTPGDAGATSLADLLDRLMARRRLLLAAFVLGGAIAFGIACLITPVFSARTSFLPPPQRPLVTPLSTSEASTILSSRMPVKDEGLYQEILQSVAINDRVIDRFGLLGVFGVGLHEEARRILQERVRVVAGPKDGLISIAVEDTDPARAAGIANAFVEELQALDERLAAAQARRRRELFDHLVERTRANVAAAERAVEASGYDERTQRAAPDVALRARAEAQALLDAEEVRLAVLRTEMSDETRAVRSQAAEVAELREQLARLDAPMEPGASSAYRSALRDYGYQTALLDIYARQFELARIEEAHRGGSLQVIDRATVPERRARPRRALVSATAALLALMVSSAALLLRSSRPPAVPTRAILQ
jgi:uncharacterized protein involved in exopolysaccharide biosynthesis